MNVNKLYSDHTYQAKLGINACLSKPHVPPVASLINPCSPHEVPHEFLTIHVPSA